NLTVSGASPRTASPAAQGGRGRCTRPLLLRWRPMTGGAPVDELRTGLDSVTSLQGLLGYLNFSEGRSDPRFQKQLGDDVGFLARQGLATPWTALPEVLKQKLDELRAGGAAAFKNTAQAEAVVALGFAQVLPAYRRHHADLLFHQSDADL